MEDLDEALTRDRPAYDSYATKLRGLVETLLESEGILTQSVTARVKTQASALAKAARPGQSIATSADLHDFLGVRVITYFADQVEAVVALLRANFEVDESRTKDRRDSIDPDRFGYLSMHLSLKLNEDRRKLVEWLPFGEISAEVQIRSSLQHSWAEIEHDLGYKSSSGSIPAQFRRRFSRLAGLLELADDEFIALRDGLSKYSSEVAAQLVSGGDASIDQASVRALIDSSADLDAVDSQIARTMGAPGIRQVDATYAGARAEELKKAGFVSIEEVRKRLRQRSDVIERLALRWMQDSPSRLKPGSEHLSSINGEGKWIKPLPQGIGLFYLYLDSLAEEGIDALKSSTLGSANATLFLTVHEEIAAGTSQEA